MDEKYTGSLSLLGMSAMTFPAYINSMRTLMFTKYLNQLLTPLNSEFPFLFTNCENVVGEESDGYKETKRKYTVFRKIVKYADIVENPKIYYLFTFNKKDGYYDVFERKDSEETLTENFGYQYQSKEIDKYEEGDTIEKGTVLYKSSSYDEHMLYSYGQNACTIFTLDPYTSEDAAEVSESFAKRFKVVDVDSITINLNDNDYLLNLFGNKKKYKPLPDIGEKFDGYLAAYRRLFKNQILFDFSEKNTRKILTGDTVFYDFGEHEVIDINIYSNNEEENDTPFMKQINRYTKSQRKFYEELRDTCSEIINSGYKYNDKIEYIYKRALDFLNTDQKWKEGDRAFSNVSIEVITKKVVSLEKGHKISGRYGNKMVISKIIPDNEMEFTEDGRRVDLRINLLAIINRTTAELLNEICITSCAYKIRKQMERYETYKEKERLLFDFLHEWNPKQEREFWKMYSDLSEKEKKDWIESAINDGIYLHQEALWEEPSVFYRILNILEKFDFLKADTLYINKWGRKMKVLSKAWVGYMYCIKLKQTDIRGFSARNTGAIDTKSLPTRSYKSKHHTEKYSSTSVRLGESETLTMAIGLKPEDLAIFYGTYRSSPKLRKDIVKVMLNADGEDGIMKLDDSYTSRVGEILYVYLKSLGLEIDFINSDQQLLSLSDSNISIHEIDGTTHFCTEYQAFIYQRIADIKKEILEKRGLMTTDELNKEIERLMMERKYITGHLYDENGNMIMF